MSCKDIEKDRAASAARQRELKARNAALGRVRRGYYATPTEHESITAHLQALRGRGAIVADPDDVLPEFRV